jgi:TonB family protein
MGCCWASLVIVHEFARNRVPATSASVSSGGVVTLTERNFSYFSLRSATLFLIAGLHAALFYGMITILSHTPGSKPPPARLVNQVLSSEPRVIEPLPPQTIEGTKVTVPTPETPPMPQIETGGVQVEYNENTVVPELRPQPRETPTHIVSRVAGGPGTGFPETSDYYPASEIRAGNEGVSTVSVCVDPRGRLTSGPTIEKSSGYVRLDEAAVKLARAGSGHYRANTEDGQPVNSCYPFGIRFQLKR